MRIEISETLGKQLKRLAKNEKKTEQACVEEALVRLLEDAEDIRLAQEALDDTMPPVSLEEAKKQLGLGDVPLDR